jgi:hypothetical protein
MIETLQPELVLALYPNMKGLWYVVFEERLRTIDWGIKQVRKKKGADFERYAQWLMNVFSPARIVLPMRLAVTVESGRLQKVAANIEELATAYGISVHFYSRAEIQAHFMQYGTKSKDEIARVIVGVLPEFGQHLPPRRKKWMSEDYRMGLFDAVALAMVYFECGLRSPGT